MFLWNRTLEEKYQRKFKNCDVNDEHRVVQNYSSTKGENIAVGFEDGYVNVYLTGEEEGEESERFLSKDEVLILEENEDCEYEGFDLFFVVQEIKFMKIELDFQLNSKFHTLFSKRILKRIQKNYYTYIKLYYKYEL